MFLCIFQYRDTKLYLRRLPSWDPFPSIVVNLEYQCLFVVCLLCRWACVLHLQIMASVVTRPLIRPYGSAELNYKWTGTEFCEQIRIASYCGILVVEAKFLFLKAAFDSSWSNAKRCQMYLRVHYSWIAKLSWWGCAAGWKLCCCGWWPTVAWYKVMWLLCIIESKMRELKLVC